MKPIALGLAASLLAGFLSLSYAQQLAAQTAPVSVESYALEYKADEEWDTVVTLKADLAGPAFWKITKNDAEVYILGSMPVMVKRFGWDQNRIERLMGRTDLYILSPELKGNVSSLVIWEMTRNKSRKLYDILPAKLTMRFRALVKKHGLDPKTFEGMHPVVAATRLKDDIYAKNNLSTRDPEKYLIFMARAKKVPMRPVSTYAAGDLIKRLKSFSEAEQITCMHHTLNEIDFALKHAQVATQNWAVGNILMAKANMPYPSAMACLEGAKTTANLVDQSTEDALKAIRTGLQRPGKTLMVLPLTVLLRKGGAFSQLAAEGAQITQPELED